MIVLAYYSPLEFIPPAISLVRMLKDMGEQVAFIGVHYTDKTKEVLKELDIPFALRQRWPSVRFREHPLLRMWFAATVQFRGGLMARFFQRRFLWVAFKRLTRLENDSDIVVWTINMQIAALFGDGLLRYGRRHVQWLPEYGEEVGRDWNGFTISKLYDVAVLIEAEINRAKMLQKEKQLKCLPFVLPNKPYGHPRMRKMVVTDPAAASVVESWGTRTVFLYQGSLGADRNGIVDMIEWICEAFPDAVMAVMSVWSPRIDELVAKYRNFSYVPFVRAPHHLEVTSHATVGLAVYTVDQVPGISPLNGLYCAPNKTFEYGGFGIPLLCNNPPGLRDSVGAAGAAVCLDELTRESVAAGAQKLLADYDAYSARARVFFESVDVEKIVSEILRSARGDER